MLASIGGLLFMGYIFGKLTFPVCAKFYLENQLMGSLYSNVLDSKKNGQVSSQDQELGR